MKKIAGMPVKLGSLPSHIINATNSPFLPSSVASVDFIKPKDGSQESAKDSSSSISLSKQQMNQLSKLNKRLLQKHSSAAAMAAN